MKITFHTKSSLKQICIELKSVAAYVYDAKLSKLSVMFNGNNIIQEFDDIDVDEFNAQIRNFNKTATRKCFKAL
jgi:uncharacterized protein with PhoU and TrkA domain